MNATLAAWAVPVQVPADRIQLVDIRRRALLLAQLRMLLIGAVFLALAGAALLRIAWIGAIEPAPNQRSMAAALLPPRGEITDRHGVRLATSVDAYDITADPLMFTPNESKAKDAPEQAAWQRRWFRNGELARRVLETLREAGGEPLGTVEIAARVNSELILVDVDLKWTPMRMAEPRRETQD